MSATIIIKKKTIERINGCHYLIENMGMDLLEQALIAGQLISEVKAELPHGTFMEWAKENLKFSHKTATNYMRLYDLEQADKLETVSNITEAYRLIKSPPKINAPAPSTTKQRAITIEAEIVEPSPSPAPPVIEAEIVEEVAAPSPPSSPPSSPPTNDAFLTILELLPELDQQELERLYTAIKTRWMRGGKEGA
jgi:hypothetical protein